MEIIFAVMYAMHQGISANLDLLYFLSIGLIVKDVVERRKLTLKAAGYVYFVVLYAFLQIVMNDQIEIGRLVINLSKLFLNVMLFLQVREMKMSMVSIKKIVYSASLFNFVLLCIGMVYKTKLLWRLDDDVNLYQKVRLALFYAEPSEASFHTCILIIVLGYFMMSEVGIRKRWASLLLLLTNAMVVVLTAGMGGILCLGIALIVMYALYLADRVSIPKLLMAFLLIAAGTLAVAWIILSNNSFYMRFNDIVNGTDGSVFYRLNVSARIMSQILANSDFVGTGLGNLNTDTVQNAYYSQGLVGVIANSFMYFIAEGGIGAIVMLLIFHIILVTRIRKHERVFKVGLLVFVFSYQIAGGYFTNPVNWILYGLVANQILLPENKPEIRTPFLRRTTHKIDPIDYNEQGAV